MGGGRGDTLKQHYQCYDMCRVQRSLCAPTTFSLFYPGGWELVRCLYNFIIQVFDNPIKERKLGNC